MVGIVFLHQIGTATLTKCNAAPFYQTGCDLVFKGYWLSLCLFCRDFFSLYEGSQRKEAKECVNITICLILNW